jgi:hypothetical protein
MGRLLATRRKRLHTFQEVGDERLTETAATNRFYGQYNDPGIA